MEFTENTPENILNALQQLKSIRRYRFISELTKTDENNFFIDIRIFPKKRKNNTPNDTFDVRVKIPYNFPLEKANLTPISDAYKWYPHQNGDWKNSKSKNIICSTNNELFVENDLAIYLEHAYKWKMAADTNTLAKPDEHYEFPHTIASFKKCFWVDDSKKLLNFVQKFKSGLVRVYQNQEKRVSRLFTLREFLSFSKKDNCESILTENIFGEEVYAGSAAWVFAENPVVEKPHRPAQTLSDLDTSIQNKALKALKKVFIEEEKGLRYLFIGYIIPSKWGGEPSHLYWETILIDKKHEQMFSIPNGFRSKNIKTYPTVKKFMRSPFNRILTENISKSSINSRSNSHLNQLRICIVGLGAVGSTFGKAICKLGVKAITFVDYDSIELGNLIRHEAGLKDVFKNKADYMVEMSKHILKTTTVKSYDINILKKWDQFKEKCITDGYDLIIDATANHGVAKLLAESADLAHIMQCRIWIKPKAQFGVFILKSNQQKFTIQDLEQKTIQSLPRNIDVEFQKDAVENEDIIFPSPGCYHPTFIADYHSIRQIVDASTDVLLDWVQKDMNVSLGTIFQKKKHSSYDYGKVVEPITQIVCNKLPDFIRVPFKKTNITLVIDDWVLQKIHRIAQHNLPNEIAGTLLGSWKNNEIIITDTYESLPIYESTPTSTVRASDKEDSRLNDIIKDQDISYLGEWHTHPYSSPTPSITDKLSMKRIAKQSNSDFTVLLIVGGDYTSMTSKIFWALIDKKGKIFHT